MKINTQTRISTLIKHNPEAIDAIASINPHFNKLRNPVLRAVLAPRVSIADAARIGKCRPEDFFDKLKAIGFEIESESPIKGIEETPATINTGLLDKIEKKTVYNFRCQAYTSEWFRSFHSHNGKSSRLVCRPGTLYSKQF